MRTLLTACILLLMIGPCRAGETLTEIKARQMLRCGISSDYPGLAIKDRQGQWTGMEIGFCKAVAAAVLEDSAKVAFLPLPVRARFSSLLTKEIDLLARNTSQTIGRESQLGVLFVGPLFITGQTFLVRADTGPQDLAGLQQGPICVLRGTTHVHNLEDLALKKGLTLLPLPFDNGGQAWDAFINGQCIAITEDASILAGGRLRVSKDYPPLRLFPDLYSRELISLAVRQEDPQWSLTIKAVLSALITAEEIGLTAEVVRQPHTEAANTADIRIFLKRTDALAASLGLTPGWAARVIGAVGHYGEMYERNVGTQGPLQLERGPNRLIRDGGMLYGVPF